MTRIESKYYFSVISMTFVALIMLCFTGVFVALLYASFTGGYAAAVLLSCLFGLLLALSLPKYLKFFLFLMTNRPALILTPNSLIDNVNGLDIKWSEIKNISYQLNKGKAPGGYIAITVVDPDKYILRDPNPFSRLIKRLNTDHFGGTFSIPPSSIKCTLTHLLNDLRQFHQTFK